MNSKVPFRLGMFVSVFQVARSALASMLICPRSPLPRNQAWPFVTLMESSRSVRGVFAGVTAAQLVPARKPGLTSFGKFRVLHLLLVLDSALWRAQLIKPARKICRGGVGEPILAGSDLGGRADRAPVTQIG